MHQQLISLILMACLASLLLAGGLNASELQRKRIISLSPHITELLFAAGAGDLLVGVAEYSDYPPEAKGIPRIGGHSGIDYERILSLRPDLIIAWPSGNSRAVIDKLQKLGLTVISSDPANLDDIARDIEHLGRLTGHGEQAGKVAAQIRQRIRSLQNQYRGRERVKLFYQIWDRPLMTINGHHILSEAVRLCGGINPFAGLTALTPQISREAVLLSQPGLVLLPTVAATAKRWQSDWQQLPGAAKWQFAQLPPDLLQRPTPRMLDGMELLCKAIDQARSARKNP